MQDRSNEEKRARQQLWQAKLGRLRLGAEPIQDQVIRHRRATWALTLVITLLGLLFFTLFTGFGRPDVGALLVAILIGPILFIAWFDFIRMKNRARAFLEEMGVNGSAEAPPGEDSSNKA